MGMMFNGPGCCCEENCTCVFTDDFSGAAVDPNWNDAGDLTHDAVNDTATLPAGTSITITPTLANGNGYLLVDFKLATQGDRLIVRFNRVDANNHWRAEFYTADNPCTPMIGGPLPDLLYAELWEVVGGVDQYRGTRSGGCGVTDPTCLNEFHLARFCWYEGGRVSLRVTAAIDIVFVWPNNFTGGNTFELEAGDSDVVLTNVRLCGHVNEFSLPCPCVESQCVTCNGDFNDTMQIEVLTGPDAGDIFIVDRYLDWPFNIGFPCTNNGIASYWYYLSPIVPIPFGQDILFLLEFCTSTTQAQLTVQNHRYSAFGNGTASFDFSDCTGPWTVTIGTSGWATDYRITVL